MGSVMVHIVTLALCGYQNKANKNFLNDDTSHVTLSPIAMKGKVIKVDPSYFCEGVYIPTILLHVGIFCIIKFQLPIFHMHPLFNY